MTVYDMGPHCKSSCFNSQEGALAGTSSHKSQLSPLACCPASITGSPTPWSMGGLPWNWQPHALQAIKGHGKALRLQCRSKSSFQICLFGWECFKAEVCFPWQRYPPLDAISSWHFKNCFMSVFSIRTVHGGQNGNYSSKNAHISIEGNTQAPS